jgi:hypothetical protein
VLRTDVRLPRGVRHLGSGGRVPSGGFGSGAQFAETSSENLKHLRAVRRIALVSDQPLHLILIECSATVLNGPHRELVVVG